MKTTSIIQNSDINDHCQEGCAMDESVNISSSRKNSAGSTIRCDDKTDCQITVDGDNRTGKFINIDQHLKEHRRMRHSLSLAKEVQQSLLPRQTPQFPGLDIAGKSIYCDETGGDYFDFLNLGQQDSEKLGVAIGDVSGHGISAALLMAAVRASLRQRVTLPGSISDIISDVNQQLVQDVEESGQFIGLFYLVADTRKRSIKWVRAGLTPAILYDPETDTFNELNGPGVALGVDANLKFVENEKREMKNGQVIVLATDGIWEARNPEGKMFGKESIVKIVRQMKTAGAGQILGAVFDELHKFRHDMELEDDITLVVIKIKN